jgi:hypothetical protein
MAMQSQLAFETDKAIMLQHCFALSMLENVGNGFLWRSLSDREGKTPWLCH